MLVESLPNLVAIEDIDADQFVAQHGPFVLTPTGVLATAHPTYEQWEAAVTWVQKVDKASTFWVGDLMLMGDMFGEMASQVLDHTDYALKTCQNARLVCAKIPRERRRPDVSFAHHQEIADATESPSEQNIWLDKCQDEQLTREALRVQLKAAKAESTGTPIELWVTAKCSSIAEQAALAEELRLRGHAVKVHAKADHTS